MTNEMWMEWQKQVIREEYRDLKPARDNAERQINKTVKESLIKVSKRD